MSSVLSRCESSEFGRRVRSVHGSQCVCLDCLCLGYFQHALVCVFILLNFFIYDDFWAVTVFS